MSHDPYAFLKFEQQVDAIQRLFEHVDFVLGGALPVFAHVQGIVGDGCHAVERAKEALSFLHKAKSELTPQGMLSVDALRIVMPARADAVLDELRQTQPAGLDGAVPTSFDIAEVQRKAQERQAVAVESPFARAQRQAAQQKAVAEALRTHGPEVAVCEAFVGKFARGFHAEGCPQPLGHNGECADVAARHGAMTGGVVLGGYFGDRIGTVRTAPGQDAPVAKAPRCSYAAGNLVEVTHRCVLGDGHLGEHDLHPVKRDVFVDAAALEARVRESTLRDVLEAMKKTVSGGEAWEAVNRMHDEAILDASPAKAEVAPPTTCCSLVSPMHEVAPGVYRCQHCSVTTRESA